jgi:ribosomal protein S18 acetylase RimI-like enzyme
MTFQVHFATADDAPDLTKFIQMAGSGIFEQLLDGILFGIKAADVLGMAVIDEQSTLHYENAIVVEENGLTLGCVLGYPSEEYGLPPVIRTMARKSRLTPLQRLFESRLDESFYINTLAVKEDERGRGIARILLDAVAGIAVERKFNRLSLHAWSDYEPAMAVYRSFGFNVVDEIKIPASKYLHHKGPMVLMSAPLAP